MLLTPIKLWHQIAPYTYMIKFKLVVLKDTSVSEKGNMTTFAKAVINNGILVTEIAGFVKTSKVLTVGESFDLEATSINTRKSKDAVEIDGVAVHFDWLEIV